MLIAGAIIGGAAALMAAHSAALHARVRRLERAMNEKFGEPREARREDPADRR
jgi:gas vesicle protein